IRQTGQGHGPISAKGGNRQPSCQREGAKGGGAVRGSQGASDPIRDKCGGAKWASLQQDSRLGRSSGLRANAVSSILPLIAAGNPLAAFASLRPNRRKPRATQTTRGRNQPDAVPGSVGTAATTERVRHYFPAMARQRFGRWGDVAR